MIAAKKVQARPIGHGADRVPPDVEALLRKHIESYEQLEALLLLRARPLGCWPPHAVAAELHITEAFAEEACRCLCRQELLERVSGTRGPLFKYGSIAPKLDAAIGKLAAAYSDQRLEVIRFMTANALDRLRLKSLGVFSDAFRVTKRSG